MQPGETVGLIVHRDHAERALRIGQKVLPHVTFSPIYADNTNRVNINQASSISDKIAKVMYGIAMAPVRSGNVAAIRRHDRLVQSVVSSVLKLRVQLSSKLSHINTTS
jgi:hypothetical protein